MGLHQRERYTKNKQTIGGGIMIDYYNDTEYRERFYHKDTEVWICGEFDCECLCDLPNNCKICEPYYLTKEESCCN